MDTTRSRRSLKIALLRAIWSRLPFNAATAAHWLIVEAQLVLYEVIMLMASINSTGPPANPMRQPVMQNDLDTPFRVRVRS